MALLNTFGAALGGNQHVRSRLAELQARHRNGELSAQGQILLNELRLRLGS